MIDELSNPDIPVPDELKASVTITTLDKIYNWRFVPQPAALTSRALAWRCSVPLRASQI